MDKGSIRKYLKELERSLHDLDPRRRKEIVKEIEEHIMERVDMVSGKRTPTEDDLEEILDSFGTPEEVALNYRVQGGVNRPYRIYHKKYPLIIGGIVILTISIIILAAALFIVPGDREAEDLTIAPGEGLENLKIGDGIDIVLNEYGEPEQKVHSGDTLWLSYRQEKGIDVLIENATKEVIELRFNEGFKGGLEGGISIGDSLDLAFDEFGPPLSRINVTKNYIDRSPEGANRVLYGQIDGKGVIEAYKYIDERKGILFWTEKNMDINQIVVFEPRETFPAMVVKCEIDSEHDFLKISVEAGTIQWSDYEVRVDQTVMRTDSISTQGGHVALFEDPSGSWDPLEGSIYEVQIIKKSTITVVYEQMITANPF